MTGIAITPQRGELVVALEGALSGVRGRDGGPSVLINVALQPPNTLLHDGHRWPRYSPRQLLALTDDALRQVGRGGFLVHASYLFAAVPNADVIAGDRLRPIVEAALEAEDRVLRSGVPACVVRLGYLYGPGSRDLLAYRRAFRIGRPYWAGPDDVKQRFLHTADAAQALVHAARQRAAGRVLHAGDNQPASFGSFMDHFARLVGNPLPLHLPELARPFSRVVVREVHMQMTELPSARAAAGPRPRRFEPRYPGYRSGLRQIIASWRT